MSISEENKARLTKLEKAERKEGEREEAELVNQFSIRDRLMRRLKSNTVKIPFTDDLGKFEIEARLLSPDEQRTVGDRRIQLLRFREELGKAPADIKEIQRLEKRGTEMLEGLYQIVADLCVDKTLDFKYWKEGKGFNIDVPMRILSEALLASQRTEAETAQFRKE